MFIIGECPKFLRNVEHITALDPYENKQANAIFKIRTACRDIEISERFILMNDDFFILRNIGTPAANFLGTLRHAINTHSTKAGYYFQALRKTQDLLIESGIEKPIDYESHYPMLLEKQKFLTITDALPWDTTGFMFRSIYGNIYNIGGKERQDTKVHRIEQLEELSKGDVISTADRVVLRPEFQRFIFSRFPTPSRYEDPETDPGQLP